MWSHEYVICWKQIRLFKYRRLLRKPQKNLCGILFAAPRRYDAQKTRNDVPKCLFRISSDGNTSLRHSFEEILYSTRYYSVAGKRIQFGTRSRDAINIRCGHDGRTYIATAAVSVYAPFLGEYTGWPKNVYARTLTFFVSPQLQWMCVPWTVVT